MSAAPDELIDHSNVVQLPYMVTPDRQYDIDASRKFLLENRVEYCNELVPEMLDNILQMLKAWGFVQYGGITNVKDILLLQEGLRSLMFRHYGIEHNLHTAVEQMFPTVEEEEEVQGTE